LLQQSQQAAAQERGLGEIWCAFFGPEPKTAGLLATLQWRRPRREVAVTSITATPRLLCRRSACERAMKIGDAGSLVAELAVAHGYLAALLFAVAHHQHVGNLLQLRVANFE